MQRRSATTQHQLTRGRKRPHVLVVEGDGYTGAFLVPALVALELTVEVAQTGQAGLERVREQRPSVIIVDLFLPGMDAIDFIAACRRIPQGRDTPVFVAASTDELLRAREPLHAYGGVAVLTKPFQFDMLASMVVPLARRKRAPRRH